MRLKGSDWRVVGGMLACLAVGACAGDEEAGTPLSGSSGEARAAAASITEADFLDRVATLAHDSMRGRATPSPEIEEAARWIAGELAAMGLEPGGGGGEYIQRYSFRPRFVDVEAPAVDAPNVAAVLTGSDPELRNEYVVFSAHMDHVGVREPDASGDSIYNGADDDASGTAAVIEIAEAFAALEEPPPRSTVFLLVSGEERGLHGSRAYADDPPEPVASGRMVANLNMDMVGRNWPDTIVAIGKEHSDLGATLERVNAAHPELGMTAIDDLWPDENFYFRSDHYNFARNGVPVLFFFNGTHDDYHRPSDEVELIDAGKGARLTRLIFYLGLEIASAPEPPEWNPESRRMIVEMIESRR